MPSLALVICAIGQVLKALSARSDIFILELSKSPNPIARKEGQVVPEPQNEKGPSTSFGPNLSTITAQEM